MGTNYYWYPEHHPHCPSCSCFESIHIGKLSFGWVFSLHVTEEIRELDDWKHKFESGTIVNEYGEKLSTNEMLQIIAKGAGSQHNADFYHRSRRSKEGTYDLTEGEFS